MAMATASRQVSGTYTPTEDLSQIEINVGFPCTAFMIMSSDTTPISGQRTVGAISNIVSSGMTNSAVIVSNSPGTNWTATAFASYAVGEGNPVIFDGNRVVIDATKFFSGTVFASGRTYNWFAYA